MKLLLCLSFLLFQPLVSISQIIEIDNAAYCVNSFKQISPSEFLLSVKTNPNALAANNELWLTDKPNNNVLPILAKLSLTDTNKIFWTDHITFSVKPDTLVVFGATVDVRDTSVSLIILVLDNRLQVISEKETKVNLPFKYPSLEQLFVPFKVYQTANNEFIGTLTIRNSKPDNIYESKAPVLQVLFKVDTNLQLKHMNQIVSDSVNLGPYFSIDHFGLLNVFETNTGNYLLAGEQGLSFTLDSAFQLVSFNTIKVLDSKPLQYGQVTYRSYKQGFISAALTLTDSSNFTNFPVEGKKLLYNLLRINEFNPNSGIQTKLLLRLPVAHDSASITIRKNGEVFFDNNLTLSNPNIASFSSTTNNDILFGYHTLSGYSKTNFEGEFNLIYLDSNFVIKGHKTFYETARTELTSMTLSENGDAWVCGIQTKGFTPQGKLNWAPYLRLVTNKELTTGLVNNDLTLHTNFTIYPNPASEGIVRSTLPQTGILRIFNTTGVNVKSVNLAEITTELLPIHDLQNGVYFVEILLPNQTSTRAKLLVSK